MMRKTRITGLILLLLLTVVHDAAPVDLRPAQLFYFNPDSPQSNLSRLKRDMDNFLSEAGFPITFQPFAHLVDFDTQIRKAPPAFIFIPAWYLKRYGDNLHLRALLVPVRNGEGTYRKVLLGTGGMSLAALKTTHPTVAMTSMGPDSESILHRILFVPHQVQSSKVNSIIVPKDIDALFALALGQVDMALVVKENMNLIAKINPNILRSVNPLLESEPIPMPVLCFNEAVASDTAVKKLKTHFLDDTRQKSRLIIMEMLQINEWQAIN